MTHTAVYGRLFWLWMAIACVVSPGAGAQLQIFFPVPVKVEGGQTFATPLSLGFHGEVFSGEELNTLQSKSTLPWAKSAAAMIEAYRTGDVATYSALVNQHYLQKNQAAAPADRQEEFQFFEPMFRGTQTSQLHYKLDVGDLTVLDLALLPGMGEGPLVVPLTLVKTGAQYLPTAEYYGEPLMQALSGALRALHGQEGFSASSTAPGAESIKIPGVSASGGQLEDDIILCFNGFRPAWGGVIFNDGKQIQATPPPPRHGAGRDHPLLPRNDVSVCRHSGGGRLPATPGTDGIRQPLHRP